MSLQRYHSIVCDARGCYAITSQHYAPSDARREAKLSGWIRLKASAEHGPIDYCPKCQHLAGDRK